MLLVRVNEVYYQLQYLLANKGQILLLIRIVQIMVVDGDNKGDSRYNNESEKNKGAKKIN